MRRIAAVLALLVLAAITALAQAPGDATDDGFLLNLLENRLSAPGRQIRLSGVSGALSSRARIAEVTISDDEGPWLRIENVELDWNRLALLRGRVNVNRLSAQRVAWLRRAQPPPKPAGGLPRAEAQPFALPELPVAIRLNELSFPSVAFDEAVFGQAAELSATGSLELRRGALDTTIAVERLDGPGGRLDLDAAFSNRTRRLAVDLRLQEPEGGIVATLLRIEDRPAIDLTLNGAGPLDEMDVDFALDAAGDRIVGGTLALRGSVDGLGFDADFGGGLAPLVPAQFRDFFAGESAVRVAGIGKTGGGFRIDTLGLRGAVLEIEGRLETGPDYFLRSLSLTGALGDPAGPAVTLPLPGGSTRLTSAQLYVDYGEALRWSGLLVLDRLVAGNIEMEDVTLNMGGLAQNLDDPARRNVTINLEGLATGLWSPDPQVASALGDRIDFFADAALPPDGPVQLRQLQISGNGLSIFSAGTFENLVYTGRNSIRVADLAIFSGLAGRELAGGADLRANGSVSPLSGGFELTFDGSAEDVRIGDPRLDPLLAGQTTLSGRAVRDENGFRTEDLRIENPQVSFASGGRIATSRTDIGFEARLTDLGLIDPRARGAVTASGRAAGSGGQVDVALQAAIPEGALMGRDLTGLRLGFDGRVAGADLTGRLTGAGQLDALVIDLGADLAVGGGTRSLRGLNLAVGPNRLTGDLSQTGSDPVTGELALDAPDIAPLAALALVEATGAVDARIRLDATEAGQVAAVTATARDVAVGANAIGALDLDAQVTDPLGLPLVHGNLAARDLELAGIEIASLTAEAEQPEPDRMQVTAAARLAIGTLVDLAGELQHQPQGFAATLQTLQLRQAAVSAHLVAPATVTVAAGTVALTPLALDFGTGRLAAEGSVGEAFDINLDITELPLALANAIQPRLGLAGRVNGTARVTGPRGAPDVRFDLAAADVASAATRAAGLPPVSLNATGRTAQGVLALDASIGAAGGLSARARGKVPLGPGALDLGVELQSFPLVLVDRMAGSPGLSGSVTGQGRVTGTLADPVANFDLRGTGISARTLRDNAFPPLTLAATGSFRGAALTLASVAVTAPPGLSLEGSGRVPLSGPGLDLAVRGTVPLAFLNPVLEERAAQASGQLRLDATATGSLAAPQFGGNVSLAGGTLVDPMTNIRLEDIRLDAGLQGDTAVLRTFSARVAAGGSISAQGSVALDRARGFPADLTARLNDVRYTDGAFLTTRVAGDLAVRGPLIGGGGLVSGRIALGTTELSIAEGLGLNAQASLEQVLHRLPPPRVQETLDRARVESRADAPPRTSPGIGLDVRIDAPNQIFVRGRGLDAELGGSLRVRGTTTDVQPVGQFDLRRGRIAILGQRIVFDEGSLTLIGDLDPEINLVARTDSDEVTAIVTVSGRASAPDVVFSSEPPLPQDEVLAHVLFNRSTANLSPFQLAQLAAAAAELAGGGGNGLLSRLRGATGLDDLDIVAGDDGSTVLRAGKYLDDNVYVDVQTNSEGVSRAEVQLDLSDRVTARGSVGTDGNTILGIFYERDY